VSITVAGRTWSVTTLWSDTDNGCIAPPPQSIPKLHPGPFGAATAGRPQGIVQAAPEASTLASLERLLPLPSIHFDAQCGTRTLNQAAVHTYIKRLFYPLHHSALFADLPEMLRTVAGMLEQSYGPSVAQTDQGGSPNGSAQPTEPARRPGVAMRK
jgi:hypothetical protein